MATARIHRPATIELRDERGETVARIPLTRPVDDLIALAHLSKDDDRRAAWLLYDYGLALHGVPRTLPLSPRDRLRTELLINVTLSLTETDWPKRIEDAARIVTTERRLPQGITESLSRLRFLGELEVEVGDHSTLAVWTLLYLAQTGAKYELRFCENCGVPFLATPRARYCRRLAPGPRSAQAGGTTCLELAKVRDHRARKKEAKSGDDR